MVAKGLEAFCEIKVELQFYLSERWHALLILKFNVIRRERKFNFMSPKGVCSSLVAHTHGFESLHPAEYIVYKKNRDGEWDPVNKMNF